jgi:phage replication-related protein YjqB (UPF0714/DUF867 family)
MRGIYQNFSALKQSEHLDRDYRIKYRHGDSGFAVIAPHGGRIEHGTSQIADAIAGDEHSFYAFEGLKDLSHDLHISSNRFDEPTALTIARLADIVITIHGCLGHEPYIYLGGCHDGLKKLLRDRFSNDGFPAEFDPHPKRQGTRKSNICNLGKTGMGIQVEMTQAFRNSLFKSPSYSETFWKANDQFYEFTELVRKIINNA